MPKLPKDNPRAVALKILLRWEKGKPLLDELLSEVLTRSPLSDERDRALVGELVNGVVRNLLYIDYIIGRFSKIPINEIDPEIKNALRLGVYQLLFTRIPKGVAIAETLKILTKRGRASWIRGFVNAVLSKVAECSTSPPEPERKDPLQYLCIKYSFPYWLVVRWFRRWDLEELEALLRASNERPPFVIRINPLKVSRENLLKYLKEQIPSAELCPYSPQGIVLYGFRGKITELKGFQFGWYTLQDSASQIVTFLLDPKPGESILDACAGVGGKTSHIVELMENRGKVIAYELYPWRLERLKENFKRLGLKLPECHEGDVVEGLKSLNPKPFDRILIDAPCTGTGVIRKHPDIKWLRTERDLEEIPKLQLRLLEGVAPYLKKGGILVYATCSLEPEENEKVVEEFLKKHPNFRLQSLEPYLRRICGERASELLEGEHYLKVYPHKHGLDGFFAVRLERFN